MRPIKPGFLVLSSLCLFGASGIGCGSDKKGNDNPGGLGGSAGGGGTSQTQPTGGSGGASGAGGLTGGAGTGGTGPSGGSGGGGSGGGGPQTGSARVHFVLKEVH